MNEKILIGQTTDHQPVTLLLKMSNRHGLITGATGTGKTVTLQTLAEQFAKNGVPVFLADIKGDLIGLSEPGSVQGKVQQRLQQLNMQGYTPTASSVFLWDVFGKNGTPFRATIFAMGPLILSRMLELNNTQTAVIYSLFKIAEDKQLFLVDIKDLTSLVSWCEQNLSELKTDYGNITKATLGAIQRSIIQIQEQGGDSFFGEPAFELNDLLLNPEGIHILDSTALMRSPKLYSMVLLWLLNELFEKLPEVGDLEKPKLVFFFDEAHLLFDDAPKILLERIETLVRLIRSKGVGVFFVTQNPGDIPNSILSQLGTRIQHALRAFTPKDQKMVKAAAQSFRVNPKIDTEKKLTELEVGVALVSVLDEKATPSMVEETLIVPPQSKIGTVAESQKQALIQNSLFEKKYRTTIDRESAFEFIQKRKASTSGFDKFTKLSASLGKQIISSMKRSISGRIGRAIVKKLLEQFKG